MAGFIEEFLAVCSSDKGKYTISLKTTCGKAYAKARLEREGYVVSNIVNARNHHICKYCGGIAEGSCEDMLCTDCRELFGHTLYSEL